MATKAKTYKVKSGDNWFNVAQKLTTQYKNLVSANPAVKKLVPGQVIKAPLSGARVQFKGTTAPIPTPVSKTPPTMTGRTQYKQPPAQPVRSDYFGQRAPVTQATAPRMSTSEFMGLVDQRVNPPRATAPQTYQPPNPRQNPRTRAQAREGQKTLANTYTNYDQVLQNVNRGVLPPVVRPETIQALGMDESYLAQLGYTRDNDYGYWVRPMYTQSGTGGYGGAAQSQGKGQAYAGQSYGGYDYGGGGYSSPSYSGYATDNAIAANQRQTGYTRGASNAYGMMPLITWRI